MWDKTLSNKARPNDIHFISEDCLQMGGSHTATVALDTYTLTLPNGITNTNNSFFGSLCVGSVGIIDNGKFNSINLFPNPFSIQAVLKSNNNFTNATLTIYNSFGQQVHQAKDLSGQTITLYRNNLPSGLYYIQLIQNNKTLATSKILIID
ncbi:MAG: T9SS type A sorting domain-containing protein [Saprospiraceae bacterium]|nr:T9SS type A sorting domain-containing protein [Candidatus Vicinibacter affinis]